MASLAFERAHADLERSEGNAVVTRTTEGDGWRTAASGAVLKGGGRHMVQFTMREDFRGMCFGLIRADWDVEGWEDARKVQGHCFYYTYYGQRLPDGARRLVGNARKEGDRIGLLLDLGAGSLTVYKNDARLGVMQESGLTDAAGYRWAVAMYDKRDSARIEGPLNNPRPARSGFDCPTKQIASSRASKACRSCDASAKSGSDAGMPLCAAKVMAVRRAWRLHIHRARCSRSAASRWAATAGSPPVPTGSASAFA